MTQYFSPPAETTALPAVTFTGAPSAPDSFEKRRVPSDSIDYHPPGYFSTYYQRTVIRRRERARYFAWRRRARAMGIDV